MDGKAVPEVYLFDDLIDENGVPTTFEASPIATINGQNATDFLTDFASINSIGMLEPHADWNQLMGSPAQDIQGVFNTFGGAAIFYPGDNLTFVLQNSTEVETQWLAVYNSPGPTGPLETGGAFYNFFVLGLYPASYDPSLAAASDNSSSASSDAPLPTSWHDISPAYPADTAIHQPDLSVQGEGILTGYFYDDISTAVLSVPSFSQGGQSEFDFSNTVADFIGNATKANLTKCIIDLQQNGGGDVVLAFDTFKQFFPTIDPFAGSRMRSSDLSNALGATTTGFWSSLNTTDPLYYLLAADEWVVTDRINAQTGQNFSSWQEFFGPIQNRGDAFSLIQQYNLSSFIFDVEAFNGFVPDGYSIYAFPDGYTQPFSNQDVVILTDGQCSSTCALFVEMMHHDAGVRTIVAGGRPVTGPMQAVSGGRGAVAYSSQILDDDIALALAIPDQTTAAILPTVRDSVININYAGFGLRDQMRPNGTIPLQFQYEAANCRIFYTKDNFYNYTRLWNDVYSAIWVDISLCVEGSSGYATAGNTTEALAAPPPMASSLGQYIHAGSNEPVINFNVEATGGLPDSTGANRNTQAAQTCPLGQSDCTTGGTCQKVKRSCTGRSGSFTQKVCLTTCYPSNGGVLDDSCPAGFYCDPSGTANGKAIKNANGRTVTIGICRPDPAARNLPCPLKKASRLDLLAEAAELIVRDESTSRAVELY